MTDMIAGAVTRYTFDKIEPWLVSIERTGFSGRIALMAYDLSAETASALEARGVELYGFERTREGAFVAPAGCSIMVDRFLRAATHLGSVPGITRLIWTDVRDVVFQSDPAVWLAAHAASEHTKLVVGSENLRYADEPWGRNNMLRSFGPDIFQRMQDQPIYCAGVIAGDCTTVLDLFVAVYAMCHGRPQEIEGGGGPDQAALNVLLSCEPYRSTTRYCTTQEDWVCHLGTSVRAIESGSGGIGVAYRKSPQVLDEVRRAYLAGDPHIDGDIVRNADGVPYCIVHQYDRVSGLREAIETRFGGTPQTPAAPAPKKWWRR